MGNCFGGCIPNGVAFSSETEEKTKEENVKKEKNKDEGVVSVENQRAVMKKKMLVDKLADWSVKQLRRYAKQNKIPTTGTKARLFRRIRFFKQMHNK